MSSNADTKFRFLDSLNIDQDVKRRLSLLLYETVSGDDNILISPIGRDGNDTRLLADLNKVFEAKRSTLEPTLIELELQNKDKFGPRSIAIPWKERKQNLYSSFEADIIRDKGIKLVRTLVPNRLRPLSVNNAMLLLKNDTNSGLPYFTRKGKVKNKVLDDFDVILKEKYPCVLFTRTQEQKKTRDVWGYPIADTLNEMRYYSPLLSYQRTLPYRSALIGPDQVNRRLTAIISEALKRNLSIVSIDFSAYDTTVKSQLQKLAFEYVKACFQTQYSSDIDYIKDRFNSIGIITPDGVKYGSHGVPSGSTFTNEVDSIVQATVASSLDYINLANCEIQGDDGVYILPTDKVDEMYSLFESYGLRINRDKSYVAEDYAIYLQNLYHHKYMKDGIIGGIYPIYRALNRIIYQERWSKFEDYDLSGKDYYSIRTISIMENCKHHPLFEDLVKLVLKYDKYALDYSSQSVSSYVKLVSDSQGGKEALSHQYEDGINGINRFATVKLIKSLS